MAFSGHKDWLRRPPSAFVHCFRPDYAGLLAPLGLRNSHFAHLIQYCFTHFTLHNRHYLDSEVAKDHSCLNKGLKGPGYSMCE